MTCNSSIRWNVVKTIGSEGINTSRAMAVDGFGNMYVTGSFNSTIVIGPKTLRTTAKSEMYLVKYDKNLNVVWVRRSNSSDVTTGVSISVSSDGTSILVTGSFIGEAFGLLSDGKYNDVFVMKFRSDGLIIWAKKFGGMGNDHGNAVVTSSDGIYVVGAFTETVSFASKSIQSNGSTDGFIVKYDNDGNELWITTVHGKSSDIITGASVTKSGDLVIIGEFFMLPVTIGNIELQCSGGTDIFVSLLDGNSSSVYWAKRYGGSSNEYGYDITVSDTSLYLTGTFNDTIQLDSHSLTSKTDSDVFVTSIDLNGNVLWAKRCGGKSNYVSSVTLSQTGKVLVSGSFEHTATFSSVSITTANNSDVFVAQYSNTGEFQWVLQAGGTGIDKSYAVVSYDSNIYVTGTYEGLPVFGAVNTMTESIGYRDVFIASLSDYTSCYGIITSSGTVCSGKGECIAENLW
jgi:hypothetical protein